MNTIKIPLLVLIGILAALSSCRKFEEEKIVSKADPYIPTNLYPIERLPKYFNRVVVLPVFHSDPDSHLLAFADQVFQQELIQERIFEVIPISTQQMKSTFGVDRVSSTDQLPSNFLTNIESATQANGILFTEVLSYSPYRPISVSIRSKLVDIKTGELMWAVDEIIDSGHASVQVTASSFQNRSQVRALSAKTSGSALHSPRTFLKFAASTIFATLPQR